MRAPLETVVGVDIGSTVVKTALMQRNSANWRVVASAWAPTTIEAPVEDVTIGLMEALKRLETQAGRTLTRDGLPLLERLHDQGFDALLCTSSAGGGCQMMVMGTMQQLTAESGQRAVLGGGALVLDVIAIDDGRTVIERIELLKRLAPDAILVSGGTDGGNVSHVIATAELIKAASPSPRFGDDVRIPIVYAGNQDARDQFYEMCGSQFDVRFVDNLRPVMEKEVMGPARAEIAKVFLEHVVRQAPGYDSVKRWAKDMIRATPAAIGFVLERFAAKYGINVLAVDVGGATTDVFSVVDGVFNRTVSAGTGVGYAVGWGEGIDFESIRSWVPEQISVGKFKNWMANKMLNPTAIPETQDELALEQSLARYAISKALEDHHKLAVELKGVQKRRGIADAFDQIRTGQARVKMTQVDALIGTGGPLVRAPADWQKLAILLDAVQPAGITEVYMDTHGVLPLAGLIEETEPGHGVEMLETEALSRLASVVCPAFSGRQGVVMRASLTMPDGASKELEIRAGTVESIPLAAGTVIDATLKPQRGVDLGNGPGRQVRAEIEAGQFGVLIDARGRPMDVLSRKRLLSLLSGVLSNNAVEIATDSTCDEGGGDS